LKIAAQEKEIEIFSQDADIGEANLTIPAKIEGNSLKVY